MAVPTFIICKTPLKLKYLSLKEIYYQLINTSLIFTYNSFKYCECYKFSGCRLKPTHRRLSRERNYYFICQMRIMYNIDKIYKLQKISTIINT